MHAHDGRIAIYSEENVEERMENVHNNQLSSSSKVLNFIKEPLWGPNTGGGGGDSALKPYGFRRVCIVNCSTNIMV